MGGHRGGNLDEMGTHRTPRHAVSAAALVASIGLLAACGGSDEAEPASAADASSEPAEGSTDESAEPAEETAEPAGAPSGSGSAVLNLANGESFEFSILCTLDSQMAAGSEILFTATSYDDPGIDITQFGDEGTITGIASVTVFNGAYDTLYDANSLYESFGGNLELALDGSTISGFGSFYEGGDVAATAVEGTLTANC